MESEVNIAKENMRLKLDRFNSKNDIIPSSDKCKEHKAACERFLEFLNKKVNKRLSDVLMIRDLKKAIKLYNEAGV